MDVLQRVEFLFSGAVLQSGSSRAEALPIIRVQEEQCLLKEG